MASKLRLKIRQIREKLKSRKITKLAANFVSETKPNYCQSFVRVMATLF